MNAPVRQGDVYLRPTTEAIPPNAKPVDRDQGKVILAYGEVTGHAHAILDPDVELFTVAAEVDRWLRVGPKGATIVHEEHGAITLAPGVYRQRQQREYSPAEIRTVAD